jgi:hypothetical protein
VSEIAAPAIKKIEKSRKEKNIPEKKINFRRNIL